MKKIEFNADDHSYWLHGKGEPRKLISVTQLMKKHGLSADFGNVDPEVLNKKAKYGSLVHQEIADYISDGTVGFTTEFLDYIQLMSDLGFTPVSSETIVYNDEIAGTYDLLAKDKNGLVLIDFKTSAKLDKDALAWQLGIYNYLLAEKADKFIAFHLQPENSKVIEISPKPVEEIEELLAAEREGRIYRQNLPTLEVDTGKLENLARCETQIAELENQIAAYKDVQKTLYDEIYSAMEKRGIKSYESELLKLTYVAPTTRQALDGKRIEKELPDIYKKYLRESPVKGSLRVKLKEVP